VFVLKCAQTNALSHCAQPASSQFREDYSDKLTAAAVKQRRLSQKTLLDSKKVTSGFAGL